MEEQKVLNVQTNQKIEAVKSSVNKKLDSMHSEILRVQPEATGFRKREISFPGTATSEGSA